MARNTIPIKRPAVVRPAAVVRPTPVSKHPKVTAHERKAAKKVNHVVNRYKIMPPATPDARGEFAGCRVIKIGADYFVNLTDSQAKFFLDSRAIELAPGG